MKNIIARDDGCKWSSSEVVHDGTLLSRLLDKLTVFSGEVNFGNIDPNSGKEVIVNLPEEYENTNYVVITQIVNGAAWWSYMNVMYYPISGSSFSLSCWNNIGNQVDNVVYRWMSFGTKKR